MKKHLLANLILAIVISRPLPLPAQELPQLKGWNVYNRLQVACEYDDNVLESVKRPVDSQSLRLLYDAKSRVKLRRFTVQLGYHGGCQLYDQVKAEHKLINDIDASVCLRVSHWLQMGVQGWARLKIFLNRENDYAYGRWQAFMLADGPGDVLIKTGYCEELLDYARTDFYSFYSPGFFLQLQRRVGPHITLLPQFSYSSVQFQRYAFRGSDDSYSFWPTSYRQRDDCLALGLGAEAVWPTLLINLGYRYEMDESNSYGYSYHRHVVTLSFVKSLGEFYIRGHSAIQVKRYHDNLLPFYPLQLDTEREESNFIVLDVSRDLCSFMGLVLRAAWYKNESPWASLYYEKRLVSLGAEFRF
ncbi:hypothetical protein JXO59_10160 [candidate division KSB1 bacterium]|nr:hypothetical protein [candidate division KSB1 bacterium]